MDKNVIIYLAFSGFGKSFFIKHTECSALEFPELTFGNTNIQALNKETLINNFYLELFKQLPKPVYLFGVADRSDYLLAKTLTTDNIYVFLPENTQKAKEDYYSRYVQKSFDERAQVSMAYWDSRHTFWQELNDPQFKIIYTGPTEYLTDYLDLKTGQPTKLMSDKVIQGENHE